MWMIEEMRRMKKRRGKRDRMPRWHIPYWYVGRCKWQKRWQEWKNDKEKEAECPYDTSPVEMEEGVNDRRYEKNEKNDE